LVKIGLVAGAAALVPLIHTLVLGGITVASPLHATPAIHKECGTPGAPECFP
jgi:hypothetical protein